MRFHAFSYNASLIKCKFGCNIHTNIFMREGDDAIKVLDKEFVKHINENEIQAKVIEISGRILTDFSGKNPLFIVVLNGAFRFAADIIRNLDMECEISFVKISSYQGDESTGETEFLIGLNENIEGRHVIIIEDIVDSGLTMFQLISKLSKSNPADIRVASLLLKPAALQRNIKVDYPGFDCETKFLIGYGLDYNGKGRELNDIYMAV